MKKRKLLITDFDGTMTQQDFYSCAVDQVLTQADLDPWLDYTAGQITHFEALKRIFARIRATPGQIQSILAAMEFDAQAADAIQQLRASDWDVVVVSNGCDWYIRQLFERHQITVDLHTSPGEYSQQHGLQMQLPVDSPYYDPETGVGKSQVVQQAQSEGIEVAFAGDGRPDLEPALMVPERLRFATGWLASELDSKDEGYRPFRKWSDIASMLLKEIPAESQS